MYTLYNDNEIKMLGIVLIHNNDANYYIVEKVIGASVLCVGVWLAADKNSFIQVTKLSTALVSRKLTDTFIFIHMKGHFYLIEKRD